MNDIIQPIDRGLLEQELTKDKFIRKTNNIRNEIYSITAHDSPYLMKEIGRLRELAFRESGGGTGKEMDIDSFDTAKNPYKQLLVWDPEEKEIVGGYRYMVCFESEDCVFKENILATNKLFHFSPKFKQNYLPHLIELGRSFVQPKYQSSSMGRKSLFALDNLWDGLGALVVMYPKVKYFFGKVTMYPSFNRKARNLILFFLNRFFGDAEKLVVPIEKLELDADEKELEAFFSGNDYVQNYKILQKTVRNLGVNIPPLVNSYMNLSATMKVFGTAINTSFGEVEETGILLTISDIYEAKKERHVNTFRIEE